MLTMHMLLLVVAGAIGTGPVARQGDLCDTFFQALGAVPHVSLTRTSGPIESIWTGEPPAACQVDFETTDSTLAGAAVPEFMPEPGTDMYDDGWRLLPDLMADGAGSGVYGISRGDARCIVRWEQPAYVDDDGTIVQSDTFTMTIQCRSEARTQRPG